MQQSNKMLLDDYQRRLKLWYQDNPLRKFRKREGYTQASLALFFGVTPTAIKAWEQGIRPSEEHQELLRKIIRNYDEDTMGWQMRKPKFDRTAGIQSWSDTNRTDKKE
jgi:transcriptional regulator with XRE-family HTH domain